MLENLEFKYPQNILFFVLVAVVTVFFLLSFWKKEKIMARLHLNHKISMKAVRAVILFLGFGLMAFSLLGPQIFEGYRESQKTSMDIYVLIDTSKSMLVSDIKPDRIAVAKKIARTLLDNLEGDRVGFIPFASDAYIQMPLTDDYQLAGMFLDVMDTNMISGGGTNLAAALRLANDSFERASGSDRVIIVLSDGEEHDDASLKALKSMTDDKLRIYTVGIGTEKGGLIPVYGDDDVTILDYLRDESGNPATSRLQPDTLRKLAESGKGIYYQASFQGAEIQSLLNELSNLERDVQTGAKTRQYQQLFQYFLGAGILLFVTVWFIQGYSERKGVVS